MNKYSFIFLTILTCFISLAIAQKDMSYGAKVQASVDRIERVLDKKTGNYLSETQLNDLMKQNPNIILDYSISKYGKKEEYSFNSDSIKTGFFNNNGKYIPLQQGEKTHEFIFQTIDNKLIKSNKLKGTYFLLRFELVPSGRFFSLDNFLKLNNQIDSLSSKITLVPIICFVEMDKNAFKDFPKSNFSIVSGGALFQEKFGITKLPTTLLFDTEGNLILSFSESEKIELSRFIKNER